MREEYAGFNRYNDGGLLLPTNRSWHLPGALAAEAIASWEAGHAFPKQAGIFRKVIAGGSLSRAERKRLAKLIRSILGFPVLSRSDRLVMTHVVPSDADVRFPEGAVWLSVTYGLQSKTLRSCAYCRRLFVATGPRRLCDLHRWAVASMSMPKRDTWKLFKDRTRKKMSDKMERNHTLRIALHDLQGMSLSDWREKWDKRAPQGRHREGDASSKNQIRRKK